MLVAGRSALFLVASLLASGCAQFRPPGEAQAAALAEAGCEAQALVEDGEDGDSQILRRAGRGGYIYTYADDKGTTVLPSSSDFKPSEGGVDGGRALSFRGKVGSGGDVYAGLGLSFTDPKGPYDASAYSGLSFVARRGEGSTANLRLKVPDTNTDPAGGVCKECFNDFGVEVQLGTEWTRYQVSFEDLEQDSGWGDPHPATVKRDGLYGVQFQVALPGADFDIWIDDIRFTGCQG